MRPRFSTLSLLLRVRKSCCLYIIPFPPISKHDQLLAFSVCVNVTFAMNSLGFAVKESFFSSIDSSFNKKADPRMSQLFH